MSTTHAGAIAAKLQGAHRARTRREDTRMSKDESVWDDAGTRIDRALKELTEAVGALAELRPGGEGGDGGDAAELARVTKERDELAQENERLRADRVRLDDQVLAREKEMRELEAENERLHVELAAPLDADGTSNPHADCWVPVPLRWATVVDGDVTVSTRGGENRLWTVTGRWSTGATLVRGSKLHTIAPDPDATVPVLVRHTERDALVALREGGVNGSVVAREVK